MQHPIETQRLTLRPFALSDAECITRLLGDSRIAEMTSNIPYPYTLSMAKDWIGGLSGEGVFACAVLERVSGCLVGCVSFPSLQDEQATLGYWLGHEYWGRGYAQEAMAALMQHGREVLGIRRFNAMHLLENSRSRSVIVKLGLQEQGRRSVMARGVPREVVIYTMPC